MNEEVKNVEEVVATENNTNENSKARTDRRNNNNRRPRRNNNSNKPKSDLEENNIKVDMIGGTSSGSLVASLYAMGYGPYYIYELFKKYGKKERG